jgi:hypothetical protein
MLTRQPTTLVGRSTYGLCENIPIIAISAEASTIKSSNGHLIMGFYKGASL